MNRMSWDQQQHNLTCVINRLPMNNLADVIRHLLPVLQSCQPDEIRFVCRTIVSAGIEKQRILTQQLDMAKSKLSRLNDTLTSAGFDPTSDAFIRSVIALNEME